MIRLRITRRRWTPEDIEAGDANDPGESWIELFEDADEVDAYLWRHFATSYGALKKHKRDRASFGRADWSFRYLDEGDTLETIRHGGFIEWTALPL